MFGGTPPAKPLNCKIRFALSGDAMDRSWAHHVGDQPMLVLAKFSLSPEDITWMSRYSCSQIIRLSLTAIHTVSCAGKIKNPAYASVSRVVNPLSIFRTCLHQVYPNCLRAFARSVPWIVPGETHNPGYTGYDVSLSRPTSSANSWLICISKFSSNVLDV